MATELISYADAVGEVQLLKWRSPIATLPLLAARGRRLATDYEARVDHPPFDNAAMDGFAVAVGGPPWVLVGSVATGSVGGPLDEGTAVRIFTGAPIPEGTISVLPIELAEVAGTELRGQIAPGRHIRRRQEECVAGRVVASQGTRVSPGVIGTLAANGITEVDVEMQPRVAVVSSGSELVPPGSKLEPGQIHDSNQPSLTAALMALGCEVSSEHVRDDPEQTRAVLRRLADSHDAILTVGGVSVGDHDYMRESIRQVGLTEVFSGVAIKPGKPVSFGYRPGGPVWFGLPGNPRSALITFMIFVREWLGCGLGWHSCPIAHDLDPIGNRETFELAHWSGDVRVLEGVGSHAVGGWAEANALVRLPTGATLRAADRVDTAVAIWNADL